MIVDFEERDSDGAAFVGKCEGLGKLEEFFIEVARLRQVLHIDRHVGDSEDFRPGLAEQKRSRDQTRQ